MKFFMKYFFSKCDANPQETADIVTFTEEVLNGKLDFMCSEYFGTVSSYRSIGQQ